MSSIKKNDTFLLYANCIPVIGATNSIICDLQRSRYVSVPLDLCKILDSRPVKKMGWYKKNYPSEEYKILLFNFKMLRNHNLGFFTEKPECFPELDLHWKYPNKIHNAIIDLNKKSKYNLELALKELDNLNCSHIQIRIFDSVSVKKLYSTLEKASNYSFRSIEILVQTFDSNINLLKDLIEKYSLIDSIIVCNSDVNEIIAYNNSEIIRSKEQVIDSNCCGVVSSEYFTVNTLSFLESHRYNSCLNKKVGIDVDGSIKNCPSCAQSYGNIQEKKITDVINEVQFQEMWKINKDQIEVCKDCEFRYICPDCRAFTIDDKVLGKPSKCSYDPYEGVWV